jgi:hypothetical protein
MMVIDVSVNRAINIGEIFIQRETAKIPEDGMCEYMIRRPEGDWNKIIIHHNYHDGWFPLLEKAIKLLKEHGFSTKR